MACYHPLLGWLSSNNLLFKNNPIKICPWTEETKQIYKEIVSIPDAYKDGIDCSDIEQENAIVRERTVKINWKSKFFEPIYQPDGSTYRRVLVPCGQCIGCRLDHSREWASRCEMEYTSLRDKYGSTIAHDSCFFVTLTYDDEHLHFGERGVPTLNYDDVKTFLDTLRHDAKRHGKALDIGIRYFGAGEYGSIYQRPHYHIILYGLHMDVPDQVNGRTDDLTFYFTNKQGDPIYKCQYLTNLWKKGFVVVGFFDWKTAAYTARYVIKKHKGKDAVFYDEQGILPEKTFCSNRPGIGFYFLEDHQSDILSNSMIQLQDGKKAPIPRYFAKHLKLWYPEYMWSESYTKTDIANTALYNHLSVTDLDFHGYFEAAEINKKSLVEKLKRSLL